jgi:hypothetical protein
LHDSVRCLDKIVRNLKIVVPPQQIRLAVEVNVKDKFKRMLDKTFQHNTFVRKAMAGDWKNYFTEEHRQIFKEIAGDILVKLEYEKDLNW